uniref:Plexin-B1 n=1 Tax=Geotrypetes seraphini TaxID=260995 RepID=A0A6P8PQ26_GEOSA|nr:plexin-B3 isoform X2 [Geotrypetes seraphini]XP_033776810.1 plexin-B3 isoform X2 [Geotrypetes seraphini]XP_033776818.1 plexin-B3 isoform X2 [Geotrypetes seraphini]XP_033776852.1 plexin-B3 isoform X2 [Geotrypetes seraphini]
MASPLQVIGMCVRIIILLLSCLVQDYIQSFPTFSRPNTTFNHMTRDPRTGILYVGAVNHLFQLGPELELTKEASTGPTLDSPDCLPFKDSNDCPQAQLTDNTNKLLVVNEAGQELIVCGQVLQGVCEKRSLEAVTWILNKTEDPSDNQFVAANDPKVNTVGLAAATPDGQQLLFVGRGLTAKLSGGISPITIRQLDRAPVFTNEGLGKLVVGDFDYDNHFVGVFSSGDHVYFLFFRRVAKSHMEYRTFVARICVSDLHLYSYVEIPLECCARGQSCDQGQRFPLAQAAYLMPGAEGGSEARLFVVFAAGQGSMPAPEAETTLCTYKLREVDEKMEQARQLCYTEDGKNEKGEEEAAIEYGVTSKCARLPKDSPTRNPCGGEHTPSPIVGQVPVVAQSLLSGLPKLSAVAALAEEGYTVVFLGDTAGCLHKVHLDSEKTRVYSMVTVRKDSVVQPDLLLDSHQRFLYVMTNSEVTRVPVAECSMLPNCSACLHSQDPFCGWCVLQGRCTEKRQCERFEEANHWLWSNGEDSQCPAIQTVNPANQSREEQTEVVLTVPLLPSIAEDEHFHCTFGYFRSQASVHEKEIICKSPLPDQLPANQEGKDYVTLQLALVFGDVIIASEDFAFYDCSAVLTLAISSPCHSCVSSPWRCHWCLFNYSCVHTETCGEGETLIIHSQQDTEREPSGPESCPLVEKIESSQLLPVGIKRDLDLIGRNLHWFQEQGFTYQCVLEVAGSTVILRAEVEQLSDAYDSFLIYCEEHEYHYSLLEQELPVTVYVKAGNTYRIDNVDDVHVTLYNCSVGHVDCSHCKAVDAKYGCIWCTDKEESDSSDSCVFQELCMGKEAEDCPTPTIHSIVPLTGPLEGRISVTISGSNLGVKAEDLMVTVAGLPCFLVPDLYIISTRVVCEIAASEQEKSGAVEVSVGERPPGISSEHFTYQNPVLNGVFPLHGPMAGGTYLTISGTKLLTGSDITAFVGELPCILVRKVQDDQIVCSTSPSNDMNQLSVSILYGQTKKVLEGIQYQYVDNPNIVSAQPTTSFYGGGRTITVNGDNLNVVQQPSIKVLLGLKTGESDMRMKRKRDVVPSPAPQVQCDVNPQERCHINSSQSLVCPTPEIPDGCHPLDLVFVLDNVMVTFKNATGEPFKYYDNPSMKPLSKDDPSKPYSLKPGNVLDIEGEDLNLGITKEEVVVMIGNGVCVVKTLTKNHLYCVPPLTPPQPLEEGSAFPEFVVRMGNLKFALGQVKYDTEVQSSFPPEAQIGLGVAAAMVVFIVLIIIFMYRRKSKQAMRDYKKVLVQLENLEISVGDQCRKEFTDLMTEMMDLTSDLEGTGIPFLDYKTYVERIFFPGHTGSPLCRNLDVPETRRSTVEQGLTQLSNLLNSKFFLIKLIHTLEKQQTFSQRDRCHAASLLTVVLHGKLEYLTDIMKTLLGDLAEQYVAKNPKLMLRRTETMVEKLLTNWMAICLYSFLREAAGEPLYMLFRAIKYQVDKGPVDTVTGKAKRTLNDSRLLREDIEYHAMMLTVLAKSGSGESQQQRVPVRVLDTDTITQVKEKILDQVYKGTPYSQRPSVHSLDLEWRSGVAGHLTLSDEDLTSVTQNQWKRINTLYHYKVPDGATVALIPRLHNNILDNGTNQSFLSGEQTPMLEDGEEGGIKLWHLVKATEEPEMSRQRRSSLRERERAKAIPEIYLTRLLSMKGTLQKFVDDTFQVILCVNRPVPIAVKYYFDFLDEMADKHSIEDQETIHIWKTHSLLLRFWVLILKNPQLICDVQVSDNVYAILSVIAQTFIDSCTVAEHKVGRDSPVNKLLYAREIPRYKQLVEKYYMDIQQTIPASYQEMNSSLTELSGNHATDLNCLVALQELYNYINKYYDQIITALEEDPMGQKLQLAYRLQQIAAVVENKVTDL